MRGVRARGVDEQAPEMRSPLRDLIQPRTLRRLASGRSYGRGEDYLADGRVRSLIESRGKIVAEVRGTRTYRVALWAEEGALEYACTCPMGDDGEFCKHCVAVGLAWLDPGKGAPKPPRKREKPTATMADVRAWLQHHDKDALVELLMEQTRADGRLWQRLVLEIARKGAKGLDLRAYRRAIDAAVSATDFEDADELFASSEEIDTAVRSLEALRKDGHAAEAVELAEYALQRVEAALGHMDDSDGTMGSVLEKLQEIHLTACKQVKPEPVALAGRLFAWELRTDWDTFCGAARRYAGVLGKEGMAEYRRLAEAEWAKVPARGPEDARRADSFRHVRITHIMEALAEATGDAEALVAVKQRDLSSPHGFLGIAEIYRQTRQPDRALEWAERGLRAFPDRPDWALQDFLAEEYHRRKRHDEAMALIWAQYADHPNLEVYQKLKRHADRIKQWATWREKALDALRREMAERKRKAAHGSWVWAERADHSELVRIFLWERDLDAAWAEAKAGGCSRDLWLELAAKREQAHPEDALEAYRDQIEPTLARKNNDAYREAIGLLRKTHGLLVRLKRTREFSDYLAALCLAHKPKRNFIKLVNHAKW